MAQRLGPMDQMFLLGEGGDMMFHVGSLLTFTPPAGAASGPDVLAAFRAAPKAVPPWNRRHSSPGFIRNPLARWVPDPEFDLDYHVRGSALPSPGTRQQLDKLVGRLHATPIDFAHPPWECHVIEGLEGGRFAIYVKVHHALVDGYTGAQLLARSLSTTPDELDTPAFFARPRPTRPPQPGNGTDFGALLHMAGGSISSMMRIGRVALHRSIKRDIEDLVSFSEAPASILNGRVSRGRSFSSSTIDLPRLKELGKAVGGSVNDVVLAICGGGLRRYLLEKNALPDKPLIAMLPVNVRPKGDPGGGNAVGAILASLGTDKAGADERLKAVLDSAARGKEAMSGLSANEILGSSGLLMTPLMLQVAKAMAGVTGRLPHNFNVVISNVPGPTAPLYFRGARLDASYPVSIPMHGLALNITCQSYVDELCFGFVGDSKVLPDVDRLAAYTSESFEELAELAAV
jgi:WS/DGAT/MGAT family acyltransferase